MLKYPKSLSDSAFCHSLSQTKYNTCFQKKIFGFFPPRILILVMYVCNVTNTTYPETGLPLAVAVQLAARLVE